MIITAAVAMSGVTGDVEEARSHLERRLDAVSRTLPPRRRITWTSTMLA